MFNLFIKTMRNLLRQLQGQSKEEATSYILLEIGVWGTLSYPQILSLQGCLKSMVHEKTIVRDILNKRMPKKTSPTNKAGDKVSTMKHEYLVILRKK